MEQFSTIRNTHAYTHLCVYSYYAVLAKVWKTGYPHKSLDEVKSNTFLWREQCAKIHYNINCAYTIQLGIPFGMHPRKNAQLDRQ